MSSTDTNTAPTTKRKFPDYDRTKPKAKAEYNPLVKLKANPTSLRLAINACCGGCHGCTDTYMEPGFKTEIRNCSNTKCGLYAVRPYQGKPAEGEEGAE